MKFRIDAEKELLIATDASRVEYHQLRLHLTRFVKNHRFQPRVKMGVWDGSVSHFKDGQIALGLWKECLNLCKLNNWKFEIENKKDFPIDREVTIEKLEAFAQEFFKNHKLKNGNPFMPYDHQLASAFNILRNRYCIAEVATGGGKSLIFALVAFYILKHVDPNAKFLLIVPNISLVTQFFDDITDYNQGFNDENMEHKLPLHLEEIMSDKPRRSEHEANIFIGTFQSLEKRPKEWFDQFYGVAADEAHKCGNGSSKDLKLVAKVLGQTFGKAKLRFGMSGTFPEETSLDFLTIQSLMGPKIAEVKADELMKKGIITPVKIKALILNHNDREFNDNITLIKRGGNGKVCFDLERKYVHASSKRTNFVIDKILSKITRNTLVLFNIKEYGTKLYEEFREKLQGIDVFYIDGDVKTDKREYIKKKMEETDGNPKLLVASFGTLSTGVSIKSLCNVIFMESYKSEQIVIQSIGRILRLHNDKEKATVFDIVDVFDGNIKHATNILYKHFLERKRFYGERNYPFEELKINL
jgi:superfamily II DNA or RNA helicase